MSRRKRLSLRTRFAVLASAGFRCHYCGRRPGPDLSLQVDHVIPVAAGGTNDRENLVASCTACNLGKAGLISVTCSPGHRGPFQTMLLPTSDVVLVCLTCDRSAAMLELDGRWSVIGVRG